MLTRKLRRLDPETNWDEVTLVLMDDEGIAEIHGRFLGGSCTTDVISFRYDPMPGCDTCSGEIVVNCERAMQVAAAMQGRKQTWTVVDELALYIAHGCDHLSGADDHAPENRRRMRNRELRWLREARKAGLLAPLVES